MPRLDLLTVLLGPILFAQGRRVRKTTPRLPEAEGPRTGIDGSGPRLRLLIAGDSAAAGVGAATQAESLTGRLVEGLAGVHEVEWRLEARTGATTRDTIDRLAGLAGSGFDVLTTSLGVNDLTRGIPLHRWLEAQRRLRRVARESLGVRCQVIAGLPPVGRFPALPQPLRWWLGRDADRYTEALRDELSAEADAHWLDLRFTGDRSRMASDGFHPGPPVYAEWGARATDIVLRELSNDLQGGA